MGKNKGKKKQGLGKEKTQSKTDAKARKKHLKDGGDDIDAILNDLKLEDKKQVEVTIVECANPSPRCNATLVAHPTEDKLLLLGGEYFDGKHNSTFNDLFLYNTSKNEFKHIKSPNSPLPRNSHQAVVLPRAGGQMWLFGGEYTSTKGDFRHYRDLWMLDLTTMAWNEVRQRGAPSQRSGHRMIAHQNKLFVFGGFYDNGSDMTYYDDLHAFDLETMLWKKVNKTSSQWPSPRAGHQFMAHAESNTALLYGGVRTEALKGGSSKTNYLSDTWQLDLAKLKWTKTGGKGAAPPPRAGMTMAIHKERALFFGGVQDEESELDYKSTCHNDMYSLALAKGVWNKVQLKEGEPPHPRRHAQMVVKGNSLYVFGGVLEMKKKEITLNDWHALDLKKMDSWKTLVGMDVEAQEWLGSDDEEEEDEKKGGGDESCEDEDEGDGEGDEPVELDDEVPLETETVRDYYTRSQVLWMSKATTQLASEGGTAEEKNDTADKALAKQTRKLAFELAQNHFASVRD